MRIDRQLGFTYLAVLFLVALLGLFLGGGAEVWHHSARRQREAELQWVGLQYRNAIASYYYNSPGSVKKYPARLEDLLEDARLQYPVRHLRKIYPNPFTNKVDWILINAPGEGIRGIKLNLPDEDIQGRGIRAEFIFSPSIR